MRIAIMGSGAVGGYFGAKLAAAGHDLVFIARGHHLEALRSKGLRVISPNGDLRIRQAAFTASLDQLDSVDLVLFCVKSYDTETAAASLGPLLRDDTTILSLQNGVDNPIKIAEVWGLDRILAGVAYIGAQLDSPGVVRHATGGKIIFGSLRNDIDPRIELLQSTLSAADIGSAVSDNIRTVQWAKLLWNAPFCAISALARANTQQILDSESLTELAVDCMAEVRAAAQIEDIELPAALINETIAFSRGLGPFKPSMLQDVEAGKRLEYEAFNGVIVRLSEQAGFPAPINRTFCALLRQLEKSF